MVTGDKERGSKVVTLADVARHAGVSAKTVSNVVNDWPYVSEEMRQKVKAAINELGYRPSALARSLATGRSNTIGVVLPDISNPFFGQAVRGCEDALNEAGYSIFLCNTDESIAKERYYLETLSGRGVDGLILWGSRAVGASLAEVVANGMPLITVDSSAEGFYNNATYVTVDNARGATLATRHLIKQGRRRIGHLAGPALRQTAMRRKAGYRDALAEAGLPYDPCLVIDGAPSIRGGYRAAIQLLKTRRPDALFCYNDLMAVGAGVACRQLDLSIPRDVALVGFDDIVIAALVTPALTTVRIAQYELGKLTSQLLLERLQNKNLPPKSVLVPVELQVRNSSGGRRLSRKQMSDLLENLVSSLAVDLPDDYLAQCGQGEPE